MNTSIKQRKIRFFAMLMVVILLLPIISYAKNYTATTEGYNVTSDVKEGDILNPGDTISFGGDASVIEVTYYDFDDENTSDNYLDSVYAPGNLYEIGDYTGNDNREFGGWKVKSIKAGSGGSVLEVRLSAVEPEIEPTAIEKIEITVEEPKVGATCIYEYSMSVSPDVDYIKESSKKGFDWNYVDEEAKLYWTYVSEGSKYEAGKRYSPYFTIPLKDGLIVTDKTVVTVNGVELEFNSKPGNEDKANYENWYKYDSSLNLVKVQYVFDELVCDHANTSIKDDEEPSCTKDGYTGDEYCDDCGELIEEGSPIPAIPHVDDDHDFICDECGAELPFTAIEKIEIEVAVPELGAECDYEFTVKVSPEIEFNSDVEWDYIDETADFGWSYVEIGDKYVEGLEYSPYFTLRFDSSIVVTEDTKVYVNGELIEPVKDIEADKFETWFNSYNDDDYLYTFVEVQKIYEPLTKEEETPVKPEEKPAEKPAETPTTTPVATGNAEKAPKTGDSMNVIVLMTIAMVAVGAVTYSVSKRKEEQ